MGVLKYARAASIRSPFVATLIAIFATASTLILSPAITHAQTVQVGIGFSLLDQDLTVGDPFPLTISAIHPEGHNVIFPRLPVEWGSFEVLSQEPVATSVNEDGSLTTSQVIGVALFAPGEHTTPPLTVTIQQPDSSVIEQPVRPANVSILSVLQSDDAELRDIKPPADVSVPSLWPWAAGGASAIGLLALAAFLLWQRRRGADLAAEYFDPRSPFEIAMDQLDAIEELDLPASEHFKQHYTLVGDTIRGYLQRQFNLRALDLTTSETLTQIRHSQVAHEEHSAVGRILRDCDLIKFTEFQPGVETSWDVAHDTRAAIRRIQPQPQVAEESGQKPASEVTS
ncbi:MAG: hypothetical protein QF898_16010 [SAR202 cluster bacterium]|nr:hypothetical protein [SAR202 cluster bacterium]MDP6511880.1 hypothetical protein [SAR202 cluster bacterium]MDP6714457.1 hypothetical protein [SAR202 cluster bacterium]